MLWHDIMCIASLRQSKYTVIGNVELIIPCNFGDRIISGISKYKMGPSEASKLLILVISSWTYLCTLTQHGVCAIRPAWLLSCLDFKSSMISVFIWHPTESSGHCFLCWIQSAALIFKLNPEWKMQHFTAWNFFTIDVLQEYGETIRQIWVNKSFLKMTWR